MKDRTRDPWAWAHTWPLGLKEIRTKSGFAPSGGPFPHNGWVEVASKQKLYESRDTVFLAAIMGLDASESLTILFIE